MEVKPTPLTEGEMERVAEGLRAVADTQEKAIPAGFMSARLGTAQRLRAMVTLLRMGASAIEQLTGSQIDLGLVPVKITIASHAGATVHVHPIVAAELERLRAVEEAYRQRWLRLSPEELEILRQNVVVVDKIDTYDVDDGLAQQKLDAQP